MSGRFQLVSLMPPCAVAWWDRDVVIDDDAVGCLAREGPVTVIEESPST